MQIVPQASSVGNEVTNQLRQGVSQGADIGVQRGMLQNALKGLSDLPQGSSAFDLARELISATAGIPGAERYVGQLFPLLLAQMRGDATKQKGGGGGALASAEGTQFPEQGGFLSAPMTQQQKLAYAERFGLGSPEDQARGLDIANKLSEGSQQNLKYFGERLRASGVGENEIPYAMQIAQKSKEANPEKLLTHTLRDLDEIRALDRALVPGLWSSVFSTGLPGKKRQPALKELDTAVKKLVAKGYEPIVRQKLADMDLSPTEVEERIHPLTPHIENRLNNLPSASRNQQRNEKPLQNFFQENVRPDVSLLVLRNKLVREKGYDWKEVNNALNQAIQNSLPLTVAQDTELTEMSQPPRDSLWDIFKSWERPIQYFKGKK